MRYGRMDELILLKNIAADGAVSALTKALENDDPASYADAVALLLEKDASRTLARYVQALILADDNLFSRRAFLGNARGEDVQAFRHDLALLQAFVESADRPPKAIASRIACGFPAIAAGEDEPLFCGGWTSDMTLARLSAFFRKNGYGVFIGNKAFTFRGGALVPVKNTSDITLADLKDYEEEKRAVEDNVVNFVEGLPYSDMLLYGDKGTGKSSTIHAVLNKYAPRGLRAVEIGKDEIKKLGALKEMLAALPFRFMIFIDDLSLEEHDEKVTSLKASLEGSMNEMSANVMIAATSNRRHILKENFSDRENSVHASDTMEEQLSLSDRFGLTVLFSSTGKAAYLSIVGQLARDRKLDIPEDRLFALAERWALEKGGRSPRRAKQFIDHAYACRAKGCEITF